MGNMSLVNVSTDELAEEIRGRMIEENDPFWPREVWELFTAIGVISCVDGFPIRRRERQVPEMGFIVRNTGPYKGKNMKWCIGGKINRGESFGQALKRHFRETLGVGISLAPGLTWNRPVLVSQHGPKRLQVQQGEFAGDEPTKYCIAPTYLVVLKCGEGFTFGSTTHGGQEASNLLWFSLNALPGEEEIAYGGRRTVLACAAWARKNL